MVEEALPCVVDVFSPPAIIQHFRDIVNVGPILKMDITEALCKFRKLLRDTGWSDDHIHDFEEYAFSTTIWEEQLPRPPRNLGDMKRYRDIKARSK